MAGIRLFTQPLLPLLFLVQSLTTTAQGVAINQTGASPDPSAALDVSASNQGFLMPRMSTLDRTYNVSSPADGLMVYDNDTRSPWMFSGGAWQELVPTPEGSLVWRTSRNDVAMQRAGYSFMGEQTLTNNGGLRDWIQPAPSTTNAPGARTQSIALWTGTEMLVWGGFDNSFTHQDDGGRYNPVSDTWMTMSGAVAPSGITGYSWVSGGGELFLWGGSSGFFNPVQDGYRYDWVADTWSSMSMAGAPSARTGAAMAWTGSKVFVWGGITPQLFGGTLHQDGFLYDPATDSWTTISTTNAPSPRQVADVHYIGGKVYVWGGQDEFNSPINDGAVYDVATDTWSPISATNSPSSPSNFRTSLGVGTRIFFFFGDEGFLYDTDTDTWTQISDVGAPQDRTEYSAVWDGGNEVIIWGGRAGGSYFGNGTVYHLDTDTWANFSLANEPMARRNHAAVWTGADMLIFGGADGSNVYQEPGKLGVPTDFTYYVYRKF